MKFSQEKFPKNFTFSDLKSENILLPLDFVNPVREIIWTIQKTSHVKDLKLKFNYETFTREDNLSSISIPLIYSLNKLKEVDVIGFSKINLSYTYSPEMDEINTNYHCDPFNLKAILISDYKNNVIKKIIPDFEYYSFQVLERDNVYPAHINNIPKIRRYLKKKQTKIRFN